MKKLVCLLLSAAFLLSLVSGCGKGGAPADTGTGTVTGSAGAEVRILWYTEGYDYETVGNIGRTPVPPEVPETVMSEKFIFTFAGWDRELVPITEAEVQDGYVFYHANYTRVKRTYQVSYVIDGKTVETLSVAYGDSIPMPTAAIPEKAGYPYSLWHAEADIVTGDTAVNAVYAEKLSYTANSKASIKDGVYYMPIVMNKHPDGRDTPAALNPARGYDSLIFYDWESDGAAPDRDKSIDRILTDLDLSYEKILADGTLLGAYCSGGQYSRSSSVSVTDSRVPFDRARRFSVHTKPSVDYGVQLSMSLPENSFEAGDVLVLSCWIRFVSAKVESNCGQIRFSCQHPTSYSKNLNYTVSRAANGEWFRFVMTFTAKENFGNLVIALGGCVQELELAGYEIRNCGGEVNADSIPRDSLATLTDGLGDLYDRDAQWRRDAWERIERIRMGDLSVTVRDENGNAVSGADVKVEMTEHDFKFGTCIAEIMMNNQNYNKALSAFFNSAVSGTGTKWACYEREPDRALRGHRIAESLGIGYFRGHTMVWDWPSSQTTNPDGTYRFDDNIPERLWKAIQAGDQAAVERYYQEWIRTAAETFSYVGEWDVLNEPTANHNLMDRYGMQLAQKWFAWARQYSPDGTKLYVNETRITDAKTAGNVRDFCSFLDRLLEAGAEFDGIGIQGHTDEFSSPTEFYNNLQTIAKKYGKEMKITEFDTGRMMAMYPYAEASYIRDILILMFSMEEMTGFFMWGFWDKMSSYENAPLFDADWNLKLSGEQYLDLVYNQWWTRESGKTGADGVFGTRAFFGTYEITVTANGKTVTKAVTMSKGQSGAFTVVI